ncbi:hypothetical protein ACFRCR_03075 [Oerskovia sp. NPDC056781]|uniref:hypothetical protein n=1 Tax=Oerskovia sp. NPDC056781 TaxID=3345942 RepID=UPI00366FBDD4
MDTPPTTALDRLADLTAELPEVPRPQEVERVAAAVRAAALDGASTDRIATVGHLSVRWVGDLLGDSSANG